MTEHMLFRHTADTLQMDWKEFRWLYYSFTSEETGKTLDSIRPFYDNALWGKGILNYR